MRQKPDFIDFFNFPRKVNRTRPTNGYRELKGDVLDPGHGI